MKKRDELLDYFHLPSNDYVLFSFIGWFLLGGCFLFEGWKQYSNFNIQEGILPSYIPSYEILLKNIINGVLSLSAAFFYSKKITHSYIVILILATTGIFYLLDMVLYPHGMYPVVKFQNLILFSLVFLEFNFINKANKFKIAMFFSLIIISEIAPSYVAMVIRGLTLFIFSRVLLLEFNYLREMSKQERGVPPQEPDDQ